MNSAAVKDLDTLTLAWREFQTRTPVKLRTIDSERHYRAVTNLMNKLVDEIGDRETHPLVGLFDIVTFFEMKGTDPSRRRATRSSQNRAPSSKSRGS